MSRINRIGTTPSSAAPSPGDDTHGPNNIGSAPTLIYGTGSDVNFMVAIAKTTDQIIGGETEVGMGRYDFRLVGSVFASRPEPKLGATKLTQAIGTADLVVTDVSSVFTVAGTTGTGRWGTSDQTCYSARLHTGDTDFDLTINSVTGAPEGWTRIALVLRESMDPASKQVAIIYVHNNFGFDNVAAEIRPTTGADMYSTETAMVTLPARFKSKRRHNRVSLYYSDDHTVVPATLLDEFDIDFANDIYVGIDSDKPCTVSYTLNGETVSTLVHAQGTGTAGTAPACDVLPYDAGNRPAAAASPTLTLDFNSYTTPSSGFDQTAQPAFSDQNHATIGYHTTLRRNQMKQTNHVFLTVWPGFLDANGNPIAATIAALKTDDPNRKIYCYLAFDSYMDTAAWADVKAHVTHASRNWPAYLNGTSGAQDVDLGYPLEKAMNITDYCPIDPVTGSPTHGMRWNEGVMVLVGATLIALGFDGLFIDNFFPHAHFQADWNRDGSTDTDAGYNPGATGSAAVWQSTIRQGFAKGVAKFRAMFPTLLLASNSAYWTDLNQNIDEYVGIIDMPWRENLLGVVYAPEEWGGWEYMMKEWRKLSVSSRNPGGAAFQCASTDHQMLAYGLASCRLEDGVFSWSDSELYNSVTDFPEVHLQLGAPIDPPLSTGNGRDVTVTLGSSWTSGVYRRRAENGMFLVNPRYNGAQTIGLGGTYYLHDGTPISSISMPDRSGAVLLNAAP